jgi:hypothetical protein
MTENNSNRGAVRIDPDVTVLHPFRLVGIRLQVLSQNPFGEQAKARARELEIIAEVRAARALGAVRDSKGGKKVG